MANVGDLYRALYDVPGVEAYFEIHPNGNTTLLKFIMRAGELQESGKLENADPLTAAKQVLLGLGVHKAWLDAPAFVPPEDILAFAIENQLGPFTEGWVPLGKVFEWADTHLWAKQPLPEGYFYEGPSCSPNRDFRAEDLWRMLRKLYKGCVSHDRFFVPPKKAREV